MDFILSPNEIRVLGSLVEKEFTTPEYYPLTLNSTMLACNQKSNRDPVMNLSENDVRIALEMLCGKALAWHRNQAGSRVAKFEQNLTNKLGLSQPEIAILCVLMLRGPCTPGELRTCTGRMHAFADLAEVEQVLQGMMEVKDARPFVVKLPREPGRKESRFAHLLGGEVTVATQPESTTFTVAHEPAPQAATVERIAALEEKVSMLSDEVATLKQALAEIGKKS